MLYYIFGICNSITWTPGTTSQALLSSTFTYGTYTIPKVTKMRYGSVSSKIYLFGSLSNVGTPYSFIRKTGSDDTTVWSTISYTQFDSNSFDLDYTESYAYTILAETATTLVRFNTADGSYDFAKEQSPTFWFAQTGYTYSLSWSPNSQTVFFSASDNLNIGKY